MLKGKEGYEVPENVCQFLDQASRDYARYKEEEFNQLRWRECREIQSPIEQMFYIALHVVAEINLVALDVRGSGRSGLGWAVFEFDDAEEVKNHLVVVPQWKATEYYVDFALCRPSVKVVVCVELDGHEFHDRNERQRRYEKKRDRFLTARGYKALHYTGSEIVKDPYAAALEAFTLATGLADITIHPQMYFGEDA